MFSSDYYSKVLVHFAAALLLVVAALSSLQAAEAEPAAQPIVADLRQLLDGHPDIAHALVASLEHADWQGITTLDAYFGYLNEAVTRIPVADSLLQDAVEFYYLINQSEALRRSEPFQQWVIRFVEDWGSFLDTPASLVRIQSFYADPRYRMDDYFVSPGGWRNFNQFFAREVKPGKRPIAGRCDERIIVSPADSVFLGVWPVADDATIEAKGVRYSIPALLDGSPYADAFRGGVFTHAFLNVNDYHRFHTPVAGKVLESRVILGKMVLEVDRKDDTGALDPLDPVGYQFTQARGLLVLESDSVGLVAVLPIGMAQVSSVTLTPEVGTELAKGEEFGFFQFGGSDIIMVFQPNRVRFTAEVNKHHLQGEQIGELIER